MGKINVKIFVKTFLKNIEKNHLNLLYILKFLNMAKISQILPGMAISHLFFLAAMHSPIWPNDPKMAVK